MHLNVLFTFFIIDNGQSTKIYNRYCAAFMSESKVYFKKKDYDLLYQKCRK